MPDEKRGQTLIIDNDPEFRTMAQETLSSAGFEVLVYESAANAMRFIKNQSWNWFPWLVITDVVLDGTSGYLLMRRINELYPKRTITFIVASKLCTADDINEAELAGASAYLRKPVATTKLINVVNQVIAKKREGKHGLIQG